MSVTPLLAVLAAGSLLATLPLPAVPMASAAPSSAGTSAAASSSLPPRAGEHPHAVAPVVTVLAMATTSAGPTQVLAPTGGRVTSRFDLVGATWRTGSRDAAAHRVQVRVRRLGRWSGWQRLPAEAGDGGADGGSADATSAAGKKLTAAAPIWVGSGADGVQARVVDPAGHPRRPPAGLRIVLVDGGTSATDSAIAAGRVRPAAGGTSTTGHPIAQSGSRTSAADATTAPATPAIYTRAQWGADEGLRSRNKGCGTPAYSSTIKVGFLHHTDTPNGYSAAAVPSILRSIYAYHVESNGWCDIGYNFLVDRFGRIWEGRSGGMTRPVLGAHSGGFNTDSFGVAMIGTYTAATPDTAMQRALERVFAWKLAANYRDPTGHETLRAYPFNESRFHRGAQVRLRTMAGHRDVDYTDCPGARGYALLPALARSTRALMAAGLVDPTWHGPSTWRVGSNTSVDIRTQALLSESWLLDVTDSAGQVIRTQAGTARTSDTITAGWDGRTTAGMPVPAGSYSVTLTPTGRGRTGVAYSHQVTVLPPVTISGPATAGYGSLVRLSGLAAPGNPVTVSVSGESDRTVVTTAAGTWSAAFVADMTHTWSATASGFTTATGTTTVTPGVTSPMPSAGNLFTSSATMVVTGTSPPADGSIEVMHDGLPVGPPAPVDPDGHWSLILSISSSYTFTIVDAAGVSSPSYTAWIPRPVAAHGPDTAGYHSSLVVTGDAGGAPTPVRLLVAGVGSGRFHVASFGTAVTTGSYALRLPSLPGDIRWMVQSYDAAMVLSTTTVHRVRAAPTISPASAAGSGTAVTVHGLAPPRRTVQIQREMMGSATWRQVASVQASSRGRWRCRVAGLTGYRLRAVSRGLRSGTISLRRTRT